MMLIYQTSRFETNWINIEQDIAFQRLLVPKKIFLGSESSCGELAPIGTRNVKELEIPEMCAFQKDRVYNVISANEDILKHRLIFHRL